MHAHAEGQSADASEIVRSLVCTNPRCSCFKTSQRGHGLTHCPVHDDSTPSLNISIKDGKVLVNCKSGVCTQEQIIEALQDRNLWQKYQPVIYSQQKIVATYDYKDIHGKLLYQAIRKGPVKDFRQRRPDGAGGWIWNLDDTERVLYRLPELVAADPRRWRVLVEGEKDVDTLCRLGFVATTNVAGAGKWLPSYSEWFRDMMVCLIPDNDVKGRDHMIQVARSLRSVARTVVWLELPGSKPKGDVTDWLEAGNDAEQLKSLIRNATTDIPESAQKDAPTIADTHLEMAMLYTCVNLPDAIAYLEPDDFSSEIARSMFRAIRAGEKIDQEALEEPDDDYDEWTAIAKLRDYSRRRSALKIAEHIVSVASDVSRVFNPCLPADALRLLCEHSQNDAVMTKLSDVLDL